MIPKFGKGITLVLLNLFAFVFNVGATPANQTQIRGDYDGDGYQDLAVAIVRPLGGNQFQTEMLARGSSGKQVFYTIPLKTDAFANGKYFVNRPTALASVLVTSIADPLLWTFVEPQTLRTVQLRYGKPGDTILNAINFDGDALDDIYVVRAGSTNEYYDGKTYLHWYVALTGSGGQVMDVLFGIAGDRVFTFYKDGKAHLGTIRYETTGTCAGQFGWYFMEFNKDPLQRKVSSTCWGLPGDIPLIPSIVDGKFSIVISRPVGPVQVAFIRDFAGKASKTKNLGLANSIPGIATLSSDGSNFFWHQRSTPGLGDTSFVAMKGSNGVDKVIQFGITSNVIIRPDGTVIQPNDSGKLGSQSSIGNGTISPLKVTFFLWKPYADGGGPHYQGKPVLLSKGSYDVRFYINDSRKGMSIMGANNGYQSADRTSIPASQLPKNTVVTFRDDQGNTILTRSGLASIVIPDPTRRYTFAF